jgi:peptide/nickel transport system permease protein
MTRYVLRRLLQMIPTLFGVILITFVLFNVVGGSPALIKLGKNAEPKALEEFDEQRGFDKPLIFGWRVKTRALADHDLSRSAGPWAAATNLERAAGLKVVRGETYRIPLAFPLREDARYEWTVEFTTPDGAPGRARLAHDESVWARLVGDRPYVLVTRMDLRRLVENPFDSQLWFFLRQLARFDLGVSSSQNLPVSQILRDGIAPTLCLTIPVLLLEVSLSVVLALLCAFYRGRAVDRAMVFGSTLLMSVNYLVWIVGGQYFLAYTRGWFPVWGFASWGYLLLPVAIGVFSGLGAEVRFYRSIMLDEMYKDYVRTAFAKGAGKGRVLFGHVLRNALIPIITNVILSVPFLYTGSLLLESFFGIPGLGYLGVNAINDSDADVIRAIVVIGSILYLMANLIADLLYALVDPRVKLA